MRFAVNACTTLRVTLRVTLPVLKFNTHHQRTLKSAAAELRLESRRSGLLATFNSREILKK